jgi:hypothetical protein
MDPAGTWTWRGVGRPINKARELRATAAVGTSDTPTAEKERFHIVQCADCRLCGGTRVQAKSIAIPAH